LEENMKNHQNTMKTIGKYGLPDLEILEMIKKSDRYPGKTKKS